MNLYEFLVCFFQGSTVWESKTDNDLLVEWNEHEKKDFNKVSPHEACWDIEKRGGVGETPLHLLFLMDSAEHTETAKIVINMYPKLALDIYEADEYYGKLLLIQQSMRNLVCRRSMSGKTCLRRVEILGLPVTITGNFCKILLYIQ